MTQHIERRLFQATLEYREADANAGNRIGGYAVVFNALSEDMGDFREIIRPGAFTRSLRENPDVRSFWNHNVDLILGRTAAGTLTIAEDETGLRFENVLPDSPAGLNAREAIRRGDVSQMSFGFQVSKDLVTRDENGVALREILEARLLEVSPVVFPAYPQTSAEIRSAILARAPEIVSPVEPNLTLLRMKQLELLSLE